MDQFLYLTTQGWKTGRSHEIEIWFTTDSGRYYIIAEHGERAHWVQNIQRNPEIRFRVGDRRYEGRARIVDSTNESELCERAAERSRAKYGWGDGLVVELVPIRNAGRSRVE
jgi:deazaflavin-dependent oxidoreductase (nitroreductase family)